MPEEKKKKEYKKRNFEEIAEKAIITPASKLTMSEKKAIYNSSERMILSKVVELQEKSLVVLEEKLPDCSAKEAAVIFGILSDKCKDMLGDVFKQKQQQAQQTNFNMYFGDISAAEGSDVLQKVINRMQESKATEEESEENIIEVEPESVEIVN